MTTSISEFAREESLLRAFDFAPGGDADTLYTAIAHVIDEHVAADLALALAHDTEGEARAHAAGRAEALMNLQSRLVFLRTEALAS